MPVVTTCGLVSRSRASRAYRTRYQGVSARCRSTHRSDSAVRYRT